MNLERVFDSILRIYPKSFRDRFGEELKLGFQDELDTNPSKLEIAKLLGDTLTSAVWERLQATTWFYWLLASMTVLYLLVSGMTVFVPTETDRIYTFISKYFAFIAITTPLVFLMRLERTPSRFELIGMVFWLHPIFLFWLEPVSPNVAFWLNFIAPFGSILFVVSHQWFRGMPLPERLLKLGLGSLALTTSVNNIFMGRIASLSEWLSSALGTFTSISIVLCFGFIIAALLWKPRAIKAPFNKA